MKKKDEYMEVKESIIMLIQKHLSLLDDIHNISKSILEKSKKNIEDSIIISINNRERLINILSYIQDKVDSIIEKTKGDRNIFDVEFINILDTWDMEFKIRQKNLDKINQDIISNIELNKSEILKDLGSVYKNNIAHKGYNQKVVK